MQTEDSLIEKASSHWQKGFSYKLYEYEKFDEVDYADLLTLVSDAKRFYSGKPSINRIFAGILSDIADGFAGIAYGVPLRTDSDLRNAEKKQRIEQAFSEFYMNYRKFLFDLN